MVLSPLNVTLSHINTAAKMTEVLRSVGGYEVPESLLKVLHLALQTPNLQLKDSLLMAPEEFQQNSFAILLHA